MLIQPHGHFGGCSFSCYCNALVLRGFSIILSTGIHGLGILLKSMMHHNCSNHTTNASEITMNLNQHLSKEVSNKKLNIMTFVKVGFIAGLLYKTAFVLAICDL